MNRFDMLPCIRTGGSIIFGFRRGRKRQEQASGSADHRSVEAGGSRAHGGRYGPGVRRQPGDGLTHGRRSSAAWR